MTELLTKIARWIWNKFVLLIFVVLLLLVANWFRSEWKDISIQLKHASLLDDQIKSAQKDLDELRKESANFGDDARKLMDKLNSEEKVKSAMWDRARRANAEYETANENVNAWLPDWMQAKAVAHREYARAESELARALAAKSQQSFNAIEAELSHSPWVHHQKKMEANEAEIGHLENQRAELLNTTGMTPSQRLVMNIRNVLSTALWILLGIILSPILIKGFLYFVLAPQISRTKPVVVLPGTKGEIQFGSSSVSTSITLAPGDEVIVHSDYLQAAGVGPGKKTRWVFSWRMPFTSLAAGLYMMVAVKNRGTEESKVTVSPKKDLFDMVCDVTIPAGSAMVIYPRSLVGIIMKDGLAPKITRHWHLSSLHSWITFQFRYIVIHGETKILMKGCRGVRAEQVKVNKASMQDQLSTLGFTANLAYSGIRCETFVDYLMGRDELFNDRFSDADGFHLTEEVPNVRRKSGIFGRGMEGIIDGFLKAFGI